MALVRQFEPVLGVSTQSNVDLRFLPSAAAIRAGMSSTGGFSVLSVPWFRNNEAIEPDLIDIESPTAAFVGVLTVRPAPSGSATGAHTRAQRLLR